MPSIKIIVNPLAGRGYATRITPLIRETFQELGADFDLVETRAAGQAIDLASQAVADGFQIVVAVGGDGTSHEVVNGMMANGDGASATLGCIPAGSGNDFAVMSGAPVDVRQACEQIVHGNTRFIDVGQMRLDGRITRYFDNAVGLGFDGWVTLEARKFRRMRGMALYVPVVLKTIFSSMQPVRATMTIDGETIERKVVMVAACNGPREGGSFLVAPEAQFDDGILDLSITDWMPRVAMLGMVPRFISGSHVTDPRVRLMRGREITITSEDAIIGHADGEMLPIPLHSVEIRTLPGVLRIIAPA
jgi:diacylglycerol kinase (ATP)